MRIAIVDDMAEDRKVLHNWLKPELASRGKDALLEEFDSGKAFLEAFMPGRYDIVFLDIYMGEVGGISVGRQIYWEDPKCKIVFLTTSRVHAVESYSVRAAYYLVKPFDEGLMREALDICCPEPAPGDVLPVRTRMGSELIRRQDIFYIESLMRHGCVCLADRVVESSDTFAQLTKPLMDDNRFLLCGRGLLLQMDHVAAQHEDVFVMEGGRHLPISRRMRAEVLKKFDQYVLDHMSKGV